MSRPYFRTPADQVPRRGATSHRAGFDQARRVDNLERGFMGQIANDTDELNMYRALGSSILTYPYDPGGLVSTTDDSQSLTNQLTFLTAVYLPTPATATGVCYYVETAGVGTWTTAKVGIYDASGTRLAQSTNDTSLLKATGFIQKAFSATVDLDRGVHYLAILRDASATTTTPTIAGRTAFSSALANLLTSSSYPRALSFSGQTDLASSYTLSSGTLGAGQRWLGLY